MLHVMVVSVTAILYLIDGAHGELVRERGVVGAFEEPETIFHLKHGRDGP